MGKWLFIGLISVMADAHAATIELHGTRYFREVADEVFRILPENFLSSVSKKISIEEKAFKTDALFDNEDLCQIDQKLKFGETRKYKISVSKRLIELAQKNQTLFSCGHKTFRNLLKAVLIHELTHVKDNQEKISTHPDFQRIVGMKRVSRNSKKKLINQNLESSPDAYEFANLEESLAVNTEFLILDPEFECRKPATANFLSQKLNIPLHGQCQKNYKVITQSAFLEDNYQQAVSIDPKRIYQVHYLFAGKGKAIMSRWGHAMFRLIVCAPYRKQAGPECLNDVSHHLTLSYRAYMSDINMSYSKGVFGGYPSQLFILRYLEVQQEYTKFELRDLYSVPLHLTSEQKKEFLDLTLERFWTYQGKYYFIDNNCGTEALKHLQVTLDQDEEKLISSITPLKMYNDIQKHKVSGEQYLIKSMFDELNVSYQFLRKFIPGFTKKSMLSFIKKTQASQRLKEYEKFISDSEEFDPQIRKQIALRMNHFERYLASKFLQEVPKKAIKLIDKDQGLKAEVSRMGETLKLLSMQPWEIVDSEYGVPLESEIEKQFPVFLSERQKDLKMNIETQMNILQNILGKVYFAKELLELDELKKIKKLTSDFINETNVSNNPKEDL